MRPTWLAYCRLLAPRRLALKAHLVTLAVTYYVNPDPHWRLTQLVSCSRSCKWRQFCEVNLALFRRSKVLFSTLARCVSDGANRMAGCRVTRSRMSRVRASSPPHLFVGDLEAAVGQLHGRQRRRRVGCREAYQHGADRDGQRGDHLGSRGGDASVGCPTRGQRGDHQEQGLDLVSAVG